MWDLAIIFPHSDLCWVVLSVLPPVSSHWLWERAGQVRSSGSIREISMFIFRSPSQNECGFNPKDEDFSLSDEVVGAVDQGSTCILFQYAGLRLIKLLNRLQSPLSSPLRYGCRISYGLELVCSKVGLFWLAFFYFFYTRMSPFLALASAHGISLLLWWRIQCNTTICYVLLLPFLVLWQNHSTQAVEGVCVVSPSNVQQKK